MSKHWHMRATASRSHPQQTYDLITTPFVFRKQADALAAMPPWASGTQPPVSLERVWPHYQRLLDTYLPEGLRW